MEEKKVKIKRFSTISWGLRLAWDMDKFAMFLWFFLCGALAVLPAIALHFNRGTLSILSRFLQGEAYAYADIVKPIVSLGLMMIAIGLSARVKGNFVSMMMYDSFFLGMFRYTMERVQNITMKELMRKDVTENWRSALFEAYSLRSFVESICQILSKAIGIAALLITAFTMSKLVFAISFVYVVVIFFISFAFTGQTRTSGTDELHDRNLLDYYEKISENHGMAKEVRIFENTDDIIAQWKKPYRRIVDRDLKRERSAVARDFISGFGFYVTLIVTVGVSLSGVARGTMEPDVFLVIFTLCLNLYGTISGTAAHIVRFDFGLNALDRQRRFFTLIKPEAAGAADSTVDEETVFEVDNLSFSYNDSPVLKKLSFSVKRGEVVALVGQNGSGKTTLTKLLLNMYKPDSGTIKMYGRALDEYKQDFIRSRTGVFFQDYFIFNVSLRENVGVGAIEDIDDEEKILEAIRLGGAEKVVSDLPSGMDTLLIRKYDPSGVELSGGEKQRVATARAHMSNREVLVFDEPASMLDPIAELEQFEHIREKLDGRTAILISHRIGFARMADKIIMLSNGEIAEMGGHDELMKKDGIYAHFFNEQAQWYNTVSEAEGEIA